VIEIDELKQSLERTNTASNVFTEQDVRHFSEFSHTLKRIHIRLLSEGYTIRNGLILKPTLSNNEKSDTIQP